MTPSVAAGMRGSYTGAVLPRAASTLPRTPGRLPPHWPVSDVTYKQAIHRVRAIASSASPIGATADGTELHVPGSEDVDVDVEATILESSEVTANVLPDLAAAEPAPEEATPSEEDSIPQAQHDFELRPVIGEDETRSAFRAAYAKIEDLSIQHGAEHLGEHSTDAVVPLMRATGRLYIDVAAELLNNHGVAADEADRRATAACRYALDRPLPFVERALLHVKAVTEWRLTNGVQSVEPAPAQATSEKPKAPRKNKKQAAGAGTDEKPSAAKASSLPIDEVHAFMRTLKYSDDEAIDPAKVLGTTRVTFKNERHCALLTELLKEFPGFPDTAWAGNVFGVSAGTISAQRRKAGIPTSRTQKAWAESIIEGGADGPREAADP